MAHAVLFVALYEYSGFLAGVGVVILLLLLVLLIGTITSSK